MITTTTSWTLIGALITPPQLTVAASPPLGLSTRQGGTPVQVGKTNEAREERVAAALRAYDDDDFVSAAEHFEAAYASAGRAEDLFNAGRAHEAAGHPQRARRYYERFLDAPGVSDEQRGETQRRIDALPPPPEVVAEKVELAPVPPMQRAQRPRDDRGQRTHKVHWATGVGIGLIPAGAASLATGGAFASVAMKNAANARASSRDGGARDGVPQQRLAERQAKMADGLLIAGGVVLGAGLVFLLSGLEGQRRAKKRRRQRERRVHVDASGLTLSF